MWMPSSFDRRYRITAPAAKYTREEMVNGKPEFVMYSGLDARNPNVKSTIIMHPKTAERLPHLKLIEVRDRDRVEISSAPPEIDIPDDWRDLPAQKRKDIAAKIAGHDFERVKDADKVIEDHVDGKADAE